MRNEKNFFLLYYSHRVILIEQILQSDCKCTVFFSKLVDFDLAALYLTDMFIVKKILELQKLLRQKTSIGFVPTMGALHEGHISLIEKSKSENEITVCSIFINPTQFNNLTDLEKYPVTIEADIEKLIAAKTDVLFLPSVEEMYPHGMENIPIYDIGYLDTILDGKFRPGHFNGVSLIVHKLLNAVKPHKLYLGEKDFQQCLVIKRMIAMQNLQVEVITCPTLREADGLAKSSRNIRLSVEARAKASLIYNCLLSFKDSFNTTSFHQLQQNWIQKLTQNGFKPEYIILANADNLDILTEFNESKKMVVLIATFLDGVRLIDNYRIN
jgi:pantoate--beta-alanine ligase